jgi:hypothetical protein
MPTLYHYTDQIGLESILQSQLLFPSTVAKYPNDVRHGNGQYLSDIVPGTRSQARLSRALFGHPFQGRRCSHYVEIEVTGLNVQLGRGGVYMIPNDDPLDVRGRIVRSGEN